MLALLLAGCFTPEPPVARTLPQIEAGAPVAGMAQGYLDFPVGTPFGGYTGRCNCFGNDGEVDKRQTSYVESFNPSVGIQTAARGHALWLENGQENLVFIKIDSIYTFEILVEEVEARLTAATGQDMDGRVIIAASHTHNAPANWDHGMTWYLGGDKYNEEVFQRFATSLETIALDAWDHREPAAIGVGYAQHWDPDDQVYSDRRPENDDLGFFADIAAGKYKDPNLALIRVDTAAGDPMGFFFSFGMHGTSLGGDNQMASTDSTGGVEYVLEDRFDTPLVISHFQSSGGDASPRGQDHEYARLESLGELGADAIIELWESTPTSTDPIRLETFNRAIETGRDQISVDRNGTVDWHYAPYDPDATPDEVIYNPDGSIASPIDEFNTQYGGAFCGSDLPLIPGVTIGSESFPYVSCIDVEPIAWIIGGFFGIPPEEVPLPLPESRKASVSASRVGPLAVRNADGSEESVDVLLAAFPGETTALFNEQFRRRAEAELGYTHTLPIGYAQDHEGYLLIPEDWLVGGYEIEINIWGPLHGEHIMEGLLDGTERLLSTDTLEPPDPMGEFQPIDYGDEPLPQRPPDLTASAGSIVDEVPEIFWVPLFAWDPAFEIGTDAPETVPRVQGLAQLMWEGGDPGVDTPEVVLERQVDGAWEPVTSPSGRVVETGRPDILLATLPDPLYPFEDPQTHTWWAGWQAVGSTGERAGLEPGTYRLHVYGRSATGGTDVWPWPYEEYEVEGAPFELVPGEITVSTDGATVSASLVAPSWGYRLVGLHGNSRGANLLTEPTLTWELDDGSLQATTVEATEAGGWTSWAEAAPSGAVAIHIEDMWGNTGSLEL